MGKWIYYVEDDTSIRELVLYALKTAEFQVILLCWIFDIHSAIELFQN